MKAILMMNANPAMGQGDITWILIAAAGVLAAILGYTINVVTAQVIKRLDEIVIELKQLSHTTTIQNEQIKALQEQDASLHRRLHKHAERIRAIESATNKLQ